MAAKHTMLGGIVGAVFDLLIDFPLDQAGIFYIYEIKDKETGAWIWGFGLGDILGAVAGGIVTYYGHAKKNKAAFDAGLGWLLALGAIKISELYSYLRVLYPVTPKLIPVPTLGVARAGNVTLIGSSPTGSKNGNRQIASIASASYEPGALLV